MRLRALLLILAAVATLGGPSAARADGAAAPFTLQTLGGETVKLADALAKGPVLISFWATWCQPCMAELPEIQKLSAEWAPRGVTVLAVNTDDASARGQVERTVKRLGLTLPVPLDEGGVVLGQYNKAMSLPYMVVIDEAGVVRKALTGYEGRVDPTLDALLGALASPAPAAAPAAPPAAPAPAAPPAGG